MQIVANTTVGSKKTRRVLRTRSSTAVVNAADKTITPAFRVPESAAERTDIKRKLKPILRRDKPKVHSHHTQ